MSFDMVRDMSGKSIASAIAGDDAAVRPRSFRRDGAASPGMLIAEEHGCRRGTRPCCSRASAIASIRYALDRHRSRAAWSAEPASQPWHCEAVCGRPGVCRRFLARFVRNPFQTYPFGRRSFNSILRPFDWVVAQMMSVCSDRGTETSDAEARSHHFRLRRRAGR